MKHLLKIQVKLTLTPMIHSGVSQVGSHFNAWPKSRPCSIIPKDDSISLDPTIKSARQDVIPSHSNVEKRRWGRKAPSGNLPGNHCFRRTFWATQPLMWVYLVRSATQAIVKRFAIIDGETKAF